MFKLVLLNSGPRGTCPECFQFNRFYRDLIPLPLSGFCRTVDKSGVLKQGNMRNMQDSHQELGLVNTGLNPSAVQ